MGACLVDLAGMETSIVREMLMGGDVDSTGWIGVVSGIACAKTAFCDETCVKVGMTFSSMDVSCIIWQSENQTMSDKFKGRTELLASIDETLALTSMDVTYVIWQSEDQTNPDKSKGRTK